jgi:long-chain-fatty-acid--CoA ligase ACSBG
LNDVRTAAKGFIALGLEPFHSVCILGFNAPEWFISDLAAIFAG